VLIVGAGFSGAVVAERLAAEGIRSLVIDRRSHVAGNAHDRVDEAGVLIHQYGPHYFRTNSDRVIEYLSRFTDWHHVEYKILSWTEGRHWQFPINLNTFEQLVGHPSTEAEMVSALAEWRVDIERPANSEEVIVSQVGWKLYEMFFKNYTRKQWQRDPKDLDASVCGRIPIRTNRDDRYLSDRFQALPARGYTHLIGNILDQPLIEVQLETDYHDLGDLSRFRHVVYTGPIDEFFDHRFGPLPYRSLRFEFETHELEFYQPAMQVNYPNDHGYTRIVEIKHATGQKLGRTTISREFPEAYGPGQEPYYPIPAPDAAALYNRYAELAASTPHVTFLGRLATYRYYNMDQVIALALKESANISHRLA
jgi:UDP-galactopyranose mutase